MLTQYSVLRLAGVSLFVKQTYEDRFWLVFTDHVLVGLFRHVQTASIQIDKAELRQALEQYVAAGAASDQTRYLLYICVAYTTTTRTTYG